MKYRSHDNRAEYVVSYTDVVKQRSWTTRLPLDLSGDSKLNLFLRAYNSIV